MGRRRFAPPCPHRLRLAANKLRAASMGYFVDVDRFLGDPHVVIGHRLGPASGDERIVLLGFFPAAARRFAQQLIEAADAAELDPNYKES